MNRHLLNESEFWLPFPFQALRQMSRALHGHIARMTQYIARLSASMLTSTVSLSDTAQKKSVLCSNVPHAIPLL
jgi:hypothetical protein